LILSQVAAGNTYSGAVTILQQASNNYVETSTMGSNSSASSGGGYGGGSITLSGSLDRIRITTVNGTDTFDAGSINILYE
jgi:hypothetical protein